MVNIVRVFPTRTSFSPDDGDAYFGPPDLFTPIYDEVHISVVFSWDLVRAERLAGDWGKHGIVRIGGPGVDGESRDEFTPGMYLREGVTITSRGCNFDCSWCMVGHPLRELEIRAGNIIQDNNILGCSRGHIEGVFDMLRGQRGIKFSGGLDSRLLKPWIVDRLRGLSISELWFSYDSEERESSLERAVGLLGGYFGRNKLRCYVLIGYGGDTISRAEERLRYVYRLGFLPFAMLYRDYSGVYPGPEIEWRRFQRSWSRPAIIKSTIK